jgi:hypothetical protein
MSLEKDFYEEVDRVHEDDLIKGKYVIYESDSIKGHRIIHFDLNSEALYREEKFP